MILIKMAMGEFLQFSKIAPEVTMNEYVDISKVYSTDKSREFVNGVLDNLLKALRKDGLV
jgi:N utilization substance protein B